MKYFQPGVGIDPTTHLPYNQLSQLGQAVTKFSRLTEIGFYIQILGEVVRGSLNNGMTREQALQELVTVLARITQMQTQYGRNGLLPTAFNYSPSFSPGTEIGFGENANLSQSIAVMIGTLESLQLPASLQTLKTDVVNAGEAFLNNQGTGYSQFYDPGVGRFRGAFNRTTNQYIANYYIDRLANEFRSGVAFVVTRYNISVNAWNNLVKVGRTYRDQNGQNVVVLAPYDGGAFQMFWPLLWSDEQDRASMKDALKNYFYTATDFANRAQIPGFPSASTVPEGGYQGKLGVIGTAETIDQLLFNIGSIYSLASAYVVNPQVVMTWLDAIFDAYPQLAALNLGFADALRSGTEYSKIANAIDQGSTILGLLGSGGNYMEQYLINRNKATAYQALYNFNLNVAPNSLTPHNPPSEFPIKSFSVIGNVQSDGVIGTACCMNTNTFGTTISYAGNTSDMAGHFWRMDQTYDARNHELIISYTGSNVPSQFTIEIKGPANELIASYPVTIPAGQQPSNGLRHIRVPLGSINDLAISRYVYLITNPTITGPSASFFINQISFRQFPSMVPVPTPGTGAVLAVASDEETVDYSQTSEKRAFATATTDAETSLAKPSRRWLNRLRKLGSKSNSFSNPSGSYRGEFVPYSKN